jgi:hypothetical protein|tara:strand:+ start:4383 stop:4562 length:180 start_codon:yes stop_codon:yes gene_type:complete
MQIGTSTQKQHGSNDLAGKIILYLIRYFSGDSGQDLLMNIYTAAIDMLVAIGTVMSSLM